jgi:hypothetical protein
MMTLEEASIEKVDSFKVVKLISQYISATIYRAGKR